MANKGQFKLTDAMLPKLTGILEEISMKPEGNIETTDGLVFVVYGDCPLFKKTKKNLTREDYPPYEIKFENGEFSALPC